MEKIEVNGTDLVNRIDLVLKQMGLRRTDLSDYIGKNKQVFTDWKNCKIIPRADDLLNMAKFLGVSMEWLLTGKDKMPDDITLTAALLMTLSEDQRRLIMEMIKGQVSYWNKEVKV